MPLKEENNNTASEGNKACILNIWNKAFAAELGNVIYSTPLFGAKEWCGVSFYLFHTIKSPQGTFKLWCQDNRSKIDINNDGICYYFAV